MKRRKLPFDFRKLPTVHKGRLKLSERVRVRVKAVRSLRSAITGFKDHIVSGYRARYEAGLRDGETLPDPGLALELAGRAVQTAIDQLDEADRVYRDHVNARRSLVEAIHHVARAEIYPELKDVRQEIDLRYGREGGRQVHGIKGPTLRKPNRLHPQVSRTVRWLESGELPKPKRPGPPGEREDWLARLKPGTDKLGRLLRDLVDSEVLEQALRRDRDYLLDAFDAEYAESLDYVRGVCKVSSIDTGWIRSLLPTVMIRRLAAKARLEREARAEGRRKADSRASQEKS